MSLLSQQSQVNADTAFFAPASGGGGGGGAGPNLTLSSLTMNSVDNGITFTNVPGFGSGDMYFSEDSTNASYTSLGLRYPTGYTNPASGANSLICPLFVSSPVQVYGPIGGGEVVVMGTNAGTATGLPKLTADTNGSLTIRSVSTVNISTTGLLVNGAPVAAVNDPTYSSITVGGVGAISSVVSEFILASTLITTDLGVTTQTVNQVSLPANDFVGGINFPKFGISTFEVNSIPDANTIGIVANGDWDANAMSSFTLGVVQQGTFPPPFNNYNQAADLVVGRLLVGGANNGTGIDPQYSGPKPFISAVNADATYWGPNPPSASATPPTLMTSPIITSSVTVANATAGTVFGVPDQTLTINNVGGNGGGNPSPAVVIGALRHFENNPLPSTFWSTSIQVGGGSTGYDINLIGSEQGTVNTTCPIIELVGSFPSTAILQVKDYGTQMFNVNGVQIGTSATNTNAEIQITPGQVDFMKANLVVSSINGQIPAAGSVQVSQSTLFTASPIGYASVNVPGQTTPITNTTLGTTFDLSGGYNYILSAQFQSDPSPGATLTNQAGAQLTVDAFGSAYRMTPLLNDSIFGKNQAVSASWYQAADGPGSLLVQYIDPLGGTVSTTAVVNYTSLVRYKG